MTRQLLTNVAALTLILPTIVGAANPPDVKALFQAAISDIGRHGGIPVYVLTTVPQARLLDSKAVVTGGERRDGYLLSLYSERGNGPAGYIGGISGRKLNSTDRELTPSKPQHEKRIKLPNGHLAIFHPVSCFGSCLAASLTWREFGAEYTLLFSLSPDTTESEQLRAMLELAKHLALGSENTDPRQ